MVSIRLVTFKMVLVDVIKLLIMFNAEKIARQKHKFKEFYHHHVRPRNLTFMAFGFYLYKYNVYAFKTKSDDNVHRRLRHRLMGPFPWKT